MPRAASSPFSCASAVFPASTSAFRISLSFLLLKKNVAASDCTCSDVVVFLSDPAIAKSTEGSCLFQPAVPPQCIIGEARQVPFRVPDGLPYYTCFRAAEPLYKCMFLQITYIHL